MFSGDIQARSRQPCAVGWPSPQPWAGSSAHSLKFHSHSNLLGGGSPICFTAEEQEERFIRIGELITGRGSTPQGTPGPGLILECP